MNSKDLFPVRSEIIYNYDFGDNWKVTSTKRKDCYDLLESNIISPEERVEANETVSCSYEGQAFL